MALLLARTALARLEELARKRKAVAALIDALFHDKHSATLAFEIAGRSACRQAIGREASPTAAVIEFQSKKSAEKRRAHDPPWYDAGKKIKGTKRYILVNTQGLLIHAAAPTPTHAPFRTR